jgi:N-acetylglucosamine-6-phosphate deacetylase
MSTLIHSAHLVTDGTETADAWVLLRDGSVAASGTGDGWRTHTAPTSPGATSAPVEVVDARDAAGPDAILTPGFIDIHTHGGGGHAHEDGAEAILAARAFHRAHGTTRSVISLVTAPLDVLTERVRTVAALTGGGILGSHLEGPFLDPGHRGAHDERMLRPHTPADLEALLAAGAGTVRQVTLAPELPGGLDAVRRVVAAGAAAAVGHTNADLAQTAAAFDAGATVLTHAFNAMPGLHHRIPGPVGAALADARVTVEAIADGVHLHPVIVRMLMDAAPGRIALVTDAMAAAGAADGTYRLGSLDVDVHDGVAHVAGTDTIAGATLTQDQALRTARAAGVPLPVAVQALTATPARAIGRGDLGSLRPGARGDAVLLTAGAEVRRVWGP